MNDAYRKILFPQMLNFITGKSKIAISLPKWTMKDIEDFWSLKWDHRHR